MPRTSHTVFKKEIFLGNRRAVQRECIPAGQQHRKCHADDPDWSNPEFGRWEWQRHIRHAIAAKQQLFLPALYLFKPVREPAVWQSGAGPGEVQGTYFCATAVQIPCDTWFFQLKRDEYLCTPACRCNAFSRYQNMIAAQKPF